MKVACLGAGYFAQFHYDAWRRLSGVELAGACDHDIAKAETTGAPAFTELSAMLDAARPDILDIITPPPSHASAVAAGIAAGVEAIICQKPFCSSLEEARQVTELAASAGIHLIIHENFRFQPWYRNAKKLMEDGEIGAPLQLTFRLRTGDGQGPDAYLDRQPYFQTMPRLLVHETAVHWVDTFRFLFGRPTAVYADLRRLNPAISGEDAGHILFEFPEGRRALFDGNRLLDHAAENHRMTLGEGLFEGTEGTLSLTGDGALHLRRFGEVKVDTVLPARAWSGFGGDCVFAFQRHVLEGLTNGQPFENEAADYLFVREVEEAIYRSSESGTRVEV
ncbi:putative dehydrogenase [Litoreibacter halocynthiae]|uniref:Putative dehydrogenase n=1 Tax=Litoreibacter halocynthiae TaxID=1242689 RepID=A0A4R7LN06_9RHOB|nr:Gfo/Idh/MocA family oxidoreductase [Litoreibacter halocynthiae]TDT77413.1 putative dehydrogenase [Litoreibacter halocynthiae]